MAKWNGEYVHPYAEHGKKSEQVKKITVSIPLNVLKVLTDERTRRQVNNLRHATNSELLCEAFLQARYASCAVSRGEGQGKGVGERERGPKRCGAGSVRRSPVAWRALPLLPP